MTHSFLGNFACRFPTGTDEAVLNEMLKRLTELHTAETNYALRYPRQKELVHPPYLLLEVAKEVIGWQ
jgi:hypothetical protein